MVNASGVARAPWPPTPRSSPVREQVVLLDARLQEWVLDRSRAQSPLLVAPRGRLTVVGSALQRGSYEGEPDAQAGAALLKRAVQVLPVLAGAEVRGHRVLVRPWRATPRVQAEDLDGRRVVHCYGHDAGGWSQAWGCAAEVERLVAATAG